MIRRPCQPALGSSHCRCARDDAAALGVGAASAGTSTQRVTAATIAGLLRAHRAKRLIVISGLLARTVDRPGHARATERVLMPVRGISRVVRAARRTPPAASWP